MPIRTKKSLGQHFLTSEGALSAIIDTSELGGDDIILEIGPGKGILTEKLLRFAGKVIAVEKDRELVPYLVEKFAEEIAAGKLDLIEKDILDCKIEDLLGVSDLDEMRGKIFQTIPSRTNSTVSGRLKNFNNADRQIWKPYKIVANIPYNITGEILRKFLSADYKPKSMTLLVQKEVAERIVAKDGKESVLSLSVKFFGTPTYIQTVKRGSFNPPPNVDSAILQIELRSTKYEIREDNFFAAIKAGFKSKRKKVISNLSAVYDKKILADIFKKLSLDENTRAEDMNLETWLELIDLLELEEDRGWAKIVKERTNKKVKFISHKKAWE